MLYLKILLFVINCLHLASKLNEQRAFYGTYPGQPG